MKTLLVPLALLATFSFTFAQDIALPAPQKTGGKPLMEALAERKSARQFSDRELGKQTLSNLLWAANGFNRPGKRTAPSARNKQEIELYVILKTGVYLYDAKANALVKKVDGNHQNLIGTQAFAVTAPLGIIFVADLGQNAIPREHAHVDAGFVSQNIYLFAASEGLATVVLASVDRPAVAKLLGLGETQEVLYSQPVGYPPQP
jgi:SagB-type dehydrogenase family enzyme